MIVYALFLLHFIVLEKPSWLGKSQFKNTNFKMSQAKPPLPERHRDVFHSIIDLRVAPKLDVENDCNKSSCCEWKETWFININW